MVKRVSATEVARNFSRVLDRVVHHGDEFIVERAGEVVCRIGPVGPQRLTGKEAAELLRSLPKADPDFAVDMRKLWEKQPLTQGSPWPGR
jgi:antitoxin (DNA-binding transcriptional repressor) of toxin-antitoxin stability system